MRAHTYQMSKVKGQIVVNLNPSATGIVVLQDGEDEHNHAHEVVAVQLKQEHRLLSVVLLVHLFGGGGVKYAVSTYYLCVI